MVKFEVYIDEVCHFFGENVPRDARIELTSTLLSCLKDQYYNMLYELDSKAYYIKNFSFGQIGVESREYEVRVLLCLDENGVMRGINSASVPFEPRRII